MSVGLVRGDVPCLPRPRADACGVKEACSPRSRELIDSGAFTNGPEVARVRARRSPPTAGGALRRASRAGSTRSGSALIAAGVEPGDEVIVPANTFVATLEAVTQAGGRPCSSTSRERDYASTPPRSRLRSAPRTRVLLPVHLYGQMADMRALARARRERGLAILEDACQAHGASRDGLARARRACRRPSASIRRRTSVHGRRRRARHRRRASSPRRARPPRARPARKYVHDLEGYTARLDTIQALVLLRKLPLLDGWNERAARGGRATTRRARRASATCACRPSPAGSEPVWHLYVVRTRAPRRALPSSCRARASARAGTIPSRSTSPPRTLARVRAGRSRWPRRSRARCSRCRSSPASPRSSSRASSTRSRASSTVADGAGQRRAVPADRGRRVRRGRRRLLVHEPLRLPDRRQHAGRPVRRDPARASVGARCKIQSHTFICDGVEIGDEVFVGHGVMFINDKCPRATTEDGGAADRGRLGRCCRRSSSAARPRLGRRDPRRRPDRRAGARRRRRRRHARRRAGRGRRRQSRAGPGVGRRPPGRGRSDARAPPIARTNRPRRRPRRAPSQVADQFPWMS